MNTDNRLNEANRLARAGQHAAALALYEQLCIDRPALAPALAFNIGQCRRQLAATAPAPSGSDAPVAAVAAVAMNAKPSFFEEDFAAWWMEPEQAERVLAKGGKGFAISTDGQRRYLSRRLQLRQGHTYVFTLKIDLCEGDCGDILLVYVPGRPEPLGALSHRRLRPGAPAGLTVRVTEPLEVVVRVGIGTTNLIRGAARLAVAGLQVAELPPEPADNPEINADTRLFLEPWFRLPAPPARLNDYSEIEQRATEWARSGAPARLKLSVVIPGHERARLLRNTLATLCRQTYPAELTEVVVVDDGSREDSYEQLFTEFAGRLNFYLARQEHRAYGLSRARNLGARSATGDVLLFLDSDILLPDGFCAALMAYHHVHDDVSVLGLRRFVNGERIDADRLLDGSLRVEQLPRVRSSNPHHQQLDPATGESLDWRLAHFESNDALRSATNPFRYFGGGHASVARARFVAVGGYDEEFQEWGNEDQEFAWRLWAAGQYFIPLRKHFDYHQEEPGKAEDQRYKLLDNERTHRLLVDRCPHPTVRPPRQAGARPAVPAFSVLLPMADLQALPSLLAQAHDDLEVLLLGTGAGVAAALAATDGRVRAIEPAAEADAWQQAMDACRGHFVLALAPGCGLQHDALAKLDVFVRGHGDLECVQIGTALRTISRAPGLAQVDLHAQLVSPRIPPVLAWRSGLTRRAGALVERDPLAQRIEWLLRLSAVAEVRALDEPLTVRLGTPTDVPPEALRRCIRGHLQRLGLDQFEVEARNPFRPWHHHIWRAGTRLAESVASHAHEPEPIVPPLRMPDPPAPGNDYRVYAEHVARAYPPGCTPHYTERVSIVVPVYNRAERLARCLAGICLQTYPKELMEVVITDDGSSDEVLSVVARYAQRLDLQYVKQADLGYRLSAARNLGIRAARHRNIAIIDCDLIPLPGFIESMMKYLHHFDNLVLLGHQRFVDPTGVSDEDILHDPTWLDRMPQIQSENTTMATAAGGEHTIDWRYELYAKTDTLRNDEYPFRAFSSGHVAYRKALIERTGGYDEEFTVWGCEDNEAGYRLMLQGAYFVPVLEAIDLHQEPPGGQNETNREKHRVISRELLQRKVPATRGWFGKGFVETPDMEPLVSLCIPTHNTGHFAVEAVRSALAQKGVSFEVIVYDDASTDGTPELIRRNFGDDPRLRLIEAREHLHITWARQRLVEASRGEFVGFLDSDDLLEPDCLRECVARFRGRPNLGLLSTGYTRIDESGAPLGDGWKPWRFDREGLMVGNVFTHFRIFRMRDWMRSRPWTRAELDRLRFGEDWDFCLRLAEVTEFDRIERPLYKYRIRSGGITLQSSLAFKAAQARSVADKWLTRLGRHDIRAITANESQPSRVDFVTR